MVAVLVRSSTNKEKEDDEPEAHEPDKHGLAVNSGLVGGDRAISKTKKFFNLFSSAKILDHDDMLKFYQLPNRANSMEDLKDLSPVCTNPQSSSRLRRYSSDQELPVDPRYTARRGSVIPSKNCAAKYHHRHHQTKLKKKTFSTLFSNQGSSIYLDCSKLNSRRESQMMTCTADHGGNHKHNNGNGSRRASVVTLGECYAEYNSESSLNCYYDQLPSVYHEDTGSTGELVITAHHHSSDEHSSLTIKDADDLDYGHIKLVGMFAMLYCWCFPLTGIFSVIYAKLAKRQYDERNMAQAKKYLSRSQLLLFVTFVGGFLLIVLGFALLDFFYLRRDRFIF